jgi:hypothetical protein
MENNRETIPSLDVITRKGKVVNIQNVFSYNIPKEKISLGERIVYEVPEKYYCREIVFGNDNQLIDFVFPCIVLSCPTRSKQSTVLDVEERVAMFFKILEIRIERTFKVELAKKLVVEFNNGKFGLWTKLSGEKKGDNNVFTRLKHKGQKNYTPVHLWPNSFKAIVRMSIVGLHKNIEQKNEKVFIQTAIEEIRVLEVIRNEKYTLVDKFENDFLRKEYNVIDLPSLDDINEN